MLQQYLMAVGAGLASAVLFVLPAKGSLAAVLIGLISPLPLMIAALTRWDRMGLVAAFIGATAIALGLDPLVAGAFAVSVAVPALALAYLSGRPQTSAPGVLLLACVLLSMFVSWAGLAMEIYGSASFEAAIDDLATQLTPYAAQMLTAADSVLGGVDPHVFARWVALALTPAAAAWGVAGLAGNLWMAGRVTAISGLLLRSWPDVPATLRLPRAAIALLGVALALCLAQGLVRELASGAVAALTVGYTCNGLAVLHGVTRGRAGRPGLLIGFYAFCFALFPWPLLVAAGLGLADAVRPIRRGGAAIPPTPKPS